MLKRSHRVRARITQDAPRAPNVHEASMGQYRTIHDRERSWRQGAVVAGIAVAVWASILLLVRTDAAKGESSSTIEAVNRFASFPITRRTIRDTDGDVAYVAEGLTRLAVALELLVRRELDDTSSVAAIGAQLRAFAVDLRSRKRPDAAAQVARDAFATASAAISLLQRSRFPELERAATMAADDARELRSDRPLAQQRMSIDRYFDSAADVLRGMAGASD